jgi:hypothetical protein
MSPTVRIATAAGADLRWLFAMGGVVSTPGAWLLLVAGRSEEAGDLVRARRLARRGGLLMAGGTLMATAGMTVAVAIAGTSSVPRAAGWTCAVTTAAAGFSGLLAGLSGKPRPTGSLAAALLAAGIVAWLTSL